MLLVNTSANWLDRLFIAWSLYEGIALGVSIITRNVETLFEVLVRVYMCSSQLLVL
jgi:hypothetical protein